MIQARDWRDVRRLTANWLWRWSWSLLPWLLLIPVGLWWLWQEGWLLVWLLISLLSAVIGAVPVLRQRWRLRRDRRQMDADAAAVDATLAAQASAVDPPVADTTEEDSAAEHPDSWAPRDIAAWQAVQRLAAEVDREVVTDHARALAVARHTVEQVARHYHPDARDAIWHFTLPEMLLLTEQVSVRMRSVILESVPAAHLIEAGHVLRIWEFQPLAKSGLRIAQHAQQLWRVARLANPMAALLAEARQRLVGATFDEVSEFLHREGARIWVEEVGRAAMDLYSGRLRLDPERLQALAARQAAQEQVFDPQLSGPPRIVVAGRVNAGKSSLINALLGETVAGVAAARLTVRREGYRWQRADLPEGLLLDTPGLLTEAEIIALVDTVWASDGLIWITAADAPATDLDQQALTAIRDRFAADPRRHLVPLLLVVSRVDQLPPLYQWEPPYTIHQSDGYSSTKQEAIRSAVLAVARDLRVPSRDAAIVRLDPPEHVYNTDAVWDWLRRHYPAILRARAQRLQVELPQRDWPKVVTQTAGAGKLLLQRFFKKKRDSR